ncbi:MAG TPA: mucoidy inhibitor MuiA family protein [Planctomycetota bacterium]|nr:mucoidy inhibitor MuiA family protein [Planctomycetota bacterium]
MSRTMCSALTLSLLAAAAASAGGGEGAPERIKPDSRIDRVVLYSSGASVRREARARLGGGRTTLVVSGLPPALIGGSLKARLEGPAGARILSVNYALEPRVRPQKDEEARLLAALNGHDAALKALNDERAVLTAQAELLRSLALPIPPKAQDGGEKPAGQPSHLAVESWGKVLDFSQGNLSRTLARLRELNESARRIGLEIGARQGELDKLRAQSVPAVASAVLAVDSPGAGEARVFLTYDVANASWYPAYSFKVDPVSGTAEMVRFAACAQNTGEDWNGAELVFSTGEPQRVAALPEVRTWQIVEGVAGGTLEPGAAGSEEPGEEVIARPGNLPALQPLLADNPFAALGFAGAGRLRDAYGYQGLGSLGSAAYELKDAMSDIPFGQAAVRTVLGVGGGGMAGVFGYRDGGGRRAAVGRFGGSQASESSVEGGLTWLAKRQQANGSWSSQGAGGTVRMDEADTALAVLAFLGAGYTAKAGRFSTNVSSGLAYLVSKQAADGSIGADLWSRALAATALSEAYAMERSEVFGRAAQRAVGALAREVGANPWPLQSGFSGRNWPDAPSNLALAALALKSAKISGLAVDGGAILQVMSMLEDLEKSPPSPLNAAAAIVVRQMLGYARMDEDNARDARTLLANLPRWEAGQMDYRYLYLGTMAMFQLGGEHWSKWNRAVRDMLVEHQARSGDDDGSWPAVDACSAGGGLPHAGASRVYATAMADMCLQVYYRYLPMYGGGSGGSGGSGSGGGGSGSPTADPVRYVPPAISAEGRDYRSRSLQAENLPSDGSFKLVAVERRQLRPKVRYLAAPVKYRGAFLEAEVANDSVEPLLAGEARMFLGTDYLGSVFLGNVAPKARFVLPLGMDPEIKLARTSRSERAEAGFRNRLRRTTYEVTVEAANHKKQPVELLVVDRIPRPSDARIRVADVAFRGGKPDYDPESEVGKVTFTVKLKPGEVGSVGLSYVVEHPSDIEAVQGRGE